MTLHDQLAVAETVRPGAFFGRKDTLSLVVDDKGYTKVDAARGKPAAVCLEPKRDEFMRFYLDGLMRPARIAVAPGGSRAGLQPASGVR